MKRINGFFCGGIPFEKILAMFPFIAFFAPFFFLGALIYYIVMIIYEGIMRELKI